MAVSGETHCPRGATPCPKVPMEDYLLAVGTTLDRKSDGFGRSPEASCGVGSVPAPVHACTWHQWRSFAAIFGGDKVLVVPAFNRFDNVGINRR